MDASSSEESDQLLDCLVTRKVILRPVLRFAERKDHKYVHDDHLLFVFRVAKSFT